MRIPEVSLRKIPLEHASLKGNLGLRAPAASGLEQTGSFRRAPFYIVFTYLCVTYGFFIAWPINWPIYSEAAWFWLNLYVAICFSVLALGHRIGLRRPVPPSETRFNISFLITLGGIATVLILIPSSFIYTGNWPWQVFDALQDQNTAYKNLQYQLVETEGQRGPLALIRALAAPLTFAVLPLGIIYWRKLSIVPRLFVFTSAVSAIIFSVLRGTDREMADLLMIGGSALLVAMARSDTSFKNLVKQYWKPALLVIVFLSVASSFYTTRKSERLGGYENRMTVCANTSGICADIDAPYVRYLPVAQRFSISLFVLSTSSGFYGVYLASEKDFKSTYGFGHSPAMLTIHQIVTGDDNFIERTYTRRNSDDGWSDENYWSSLITWIANDVGFPGAVIVLGVLGYGWARSWRDATEGNNDAAAVIFCLFMVMLFYLPANNQVFGIYDGYFVFGVWVFLWMRSRTSRPMMRAKLT